MVRPSRVHATIALAGLLALGIAACGGTSPATVAPGATGTAAAATTTPSAAGTTAPTSAPATGGMTAGPASALAASFCKPWAEDVVAHWPPFEQLEAELINRDLTTWQKDPALATVAADMAKVFDYVDFVAHGGSYRPASPEVESAYSSINTFAVANC